MQPETMPNAVSRPAKLISFLIFILLLSTLSFFTANAAIIMSDSIYQGVIVGDTDVGGLSEEAAKQKLLTVFRTRTAEPIRLLYGEKFWTVKAEDIDLHIDAGQLASKAYQVGRKGNIVAQLQERYLTINQGYIVPLAVSFNPDKINSVLMDISATLDTNPRSATLLVNQADITLIPDEIGRKLNIVKSLAEITTAINLHLSFSVKLTVDEIMPPVRAADLQDINHILASYTTQFDLSDTNRSENILIAAQKVNNTLVASGQSFSFNTKVGLRLPEYGYKKAPAYIDGVLVPDWGGGVCQVSSTIYNVALLADMAIEERTSHLRPPGYVPLGQDATVADNALDFRFRNTTPSNIYIKAEVLGNQVEIIILGKRMQGIPEIQILASDTKVIEPKTIVKQDPTLELGKQVVEEEGQKGFLVTTQRIKRINGKEVSRELLGVDDFRPVDTILRVGTKAPANISKEKNVMVK